MKHHLGFGDKVRVKKEVLDAIPSGYVRSHVNGEGTIKKNWNSGWFTVEFDAFKWEHGFYGDELELVTKKRELDEMVREEKLAKQIEMANDIKAEVEYD